MINSKILIMIPALNEGRIVGRLINEIKNVTHEFNCSILVIDDGSSDNTKFEAENAGASVVSLPFNLGIGGAVQTAFKIAAIENYDIAVQIDGDAQHNPSYLNQVIQPVLLNKLDLCIGSRFITETSPFKSTWFRRIGIRFFSILLSMLTRASLTDPTSGFRACNKKLIKQFAAYYPVDFPEPEAIQIAKRFHSRIGEVPVHMRKRLGGRSSIRYFATLYYMIKVTFAILIDTLKSKKGANHEC